MPDSGLQLRSLVRDDYTREVTQAEAISIYGRQANGEKYLITPHR